MKIRNVKTIFGKEIKDTLRDRRTLIFMIMVPIIGIPLLIMFTSNLMIKSVSKAQEEKAEILIEGSQNLPQDLFAEISESDKLVLTLLEDIDSEDPVEDIKAGLYQAYIIIPEYFLSAVENESPTEIEIFYDRAEIKSEFAVDKLKAIFNPYKEKVIQNRLEKREISSDILTPFEISSMNVASMRKVAGKELGGFLPYLIIITCFLGAVYPAIDLAAGEKERGTLETLLVSPASRAEFVVGKYLVILTTGVVAALLSMISLTFSLNYMLGNMVEEMGRLLAIQYDFNTVILTILIILPMAGIFASILLSVSIFARSFKEAQSYITALNMVIILPAFISLLPGVELNLEMALIPVVNVSLILKEAVAGTVDWIYVITAFVSTLILAVLALYLCKKWFERESVLFRA